MSSMKITTKAGDGQKRQGGAKGADTHMAINKCRFKYHGNNCEIWQNNRKD